MPRLFAAAAMAASIVLSFPPLPVSADQSADFVVSGATPAVNSVSTQVAKPARTASRAVARTQWSVAIPTTSTWMTSRARSHWVNPAPPGSRPSKPEYAAS